MGTYNHMECNDMTLFIWNFITTIATAAAESFKHCNCCDYRGVDAPYLYNGDWYELEI